MRHPLQSPAVLSAALAVVWAACILAPAGTASGLETDQFTVPPEPLVDISPQFQQHATAVLQGVVSRANIRHLDESKAAAAATSSFWRGIHAKSAAECLTDEYVVRAYYHEVGRGLPESRFEEWVVRSRFPTGPAKFDPSIGDSAYGANPLGRPLTLQQLSPTVNLFGHYMGADKIGHLFQQGFEYWEAYQAARAKGEDDAAARKAAVAVGSGQELGIFGLTMVGVYSNGDMSSNYAGLKFYLNLTQPVAVDGRTLPPILVKRQGLWEINEEAGRNWLRPYFTDHFNESLNPSRYNGQLRDSLHKHFPDRAAKWVAFYRSTRETEAARMKRLSTWHGEDYGHSGLERVVSVVDLYYDRPGVGQPAMARR